VLEIDRFTSFRDTLGAVGADQLVAVVAERITGAVRDEDTVARVGGHQIAMIVPDAGGPAEVAVVLGSVLRSLTGALAVGQHELYVASKVGVAIYPSDGADGEELLRNAEVAAGRAMASGKHQWQFFHSSMNAEHDRRLELEADLHRALERGQLVLHYQPQVVAGTGDLVALEALLRWRHPTRGLIPPMDFIPLAEESGLMVPIGAWVLREACANMAEWNRRCGSDTRVCVNLSLRQLHSQELSDVVAEALRTSALHPSLLELEITESLAMSDPEITARVLRAFGETGVRVALDDFGTGYSSLSHVVQLPVDTVKIDRSFVRDLTEVPQHAAVASAVITLAHRLGLSVVAEGVETADQRVFLHEEGCDLIQGFFFSRPVPADECELLIKGRTLIP
jgi:diguanylate cyclase (GGDEF)-like protein